MIKQIKSFVEAVGALFLLALIASFVAAIITIPAAFAYITATHIWNFLVK